MKKIILTLLVMVGSLAVNAGGDWRGTLDKVWDLGGDMVMAGFILLFVIDFLVKKYLGFLYRIYRY